MNAWGIVLGILLAIVSIAIIVVIILQRWTKVFAAVFVLFVIALNVLSYFNLLG